MCWCWLTMSLVNMIVESSWSYSLAPEKWSCKFWYVLLSLLAYRVLCEGNPPFIGGFPSQRTSNVKTHLYDMASSCNPYKKNCTCLLYWDICYTSLLQICLYTIQVPEFTNQLRPIEPIHWNSYHTMWQAHIFLTSATQDHWNINTCCTKFKGHLSMMVCLCQIHIKSC